MKSNQKYYSPQFYSLNDITGEIEMKSKVYLIKKKENETDESLAKRLHYHLKINDFFKFIKPKDFVAVKTHFGEKGSNGYVRPLYFKKISKLIKEKKAKPFLTETQTLYTGLRNNAVTHIELAISHGFTYEQTGMPIIMADGLLGDEEISVEIPGKIYKQVNIAGLLEKIQSLVVISHFTGHIAAGFGATLKNLGMGLSSRKGKLTQHSTAKPNVKEKKCVGCGLCIKFCPSSAITMKENQKASINSEKCIGCGECLAICRFDAIGYNWAETYENLQRKIVEHAMGVHLLFKSKVFYITFLTRITKDCDCMSRFQPIVPDIGILLSEDPVALDSASLYLIETINGKKLNELSYNIPYTVQLEHAKELKFGSTDYDLIELT